ncbi:MAG: hypothetical protein GY853_14360 [PVC group bacterium]|nr:hypothetical protein [PVC group bacterium]
MKTGTQTPRPEYVKEGKGRIYKGIPKHVPKSAIRTMIQWVGDKKYIILGYMVFDSDNPGVQPGLFDLIGRTSTPKGNNFYYDLYNQGTK